MPDACGPTDRHPEPTKGGRGRFYCFTRKHHGSKRSPHAQWNILRPEEFSVFEMADRHRLDDQHGNMYGLCIRPEGKRFRLAELGTRKEQIARFWFVEGDVYWHGHPLWPTKTREKTKRSNEDYCPPDEVFDRMELENFLTDGESSKLKRGDTLGRLKRYKP